MADIEKEVKSFNGTVVGNPTIDLDTGIVSGFSTSNYLVLPEAFDYTQPYQIYIKFTTPSAITTFTPILSSSVVYSLLPFYFDINSFVLTGYASSNNSSWDIFSNVTVKTCSANTTYTMMFEFTGSAYIWYEYQNGSWVELTRITSSTSTYSGGKIQLGAWETHRWSGSIDLSETYININGERWWNPIKTGTYYGSTFKVHQTLPYMFGARGVGYYDSVVSKVPTANEDILLTMKTYDGLTETYTEGIGTAGKVDFTGTILPWKWDYNSGLDVSKYCLMPSGLTYENIKTPDVFGRNFTVIGSPTINDSTGIVSGFSTVNGLLWPEIYSGTATSWEIVVKCTTGTDLTSPQVFFAQGEVDFHGALGFLYNGNFLVYASNDNSSWNIASAGQIIAASANTTYWFKYSWNGSIFSVSYSTDGETYTVAQTYSSQPLFTSNNVYLGYRGCDTTNYLRGSIDLSETYININGERWWTPYILASYSLPGCTYNFEDDGSAATLNAFAVQGDKNIVLTPDVEYYGNRYLGTVEIPQHDVYQYNNGTWQNAPYLIGGHTYYFKMIGGGGGSSTWEGGAGAYWEGYYTPAQTVAVVLSQGGGGSGAGAYSRNHNGVKGGTTSLIGEGVSIVCEGGQGAIGLREGDETGNSSTYTYAPTITISNGTYETIKASTHYRPRRISWNDDTVTGYGAGGQAAASTKAPGHDGLAGYLEYYQVGTITINPTPADALVEMSLDGIEYTTTSSLIAKVGEVVYYRVSKEGYISEDTLVLVEGNETINVELTEEPQP